LRPITPHPSATAAAADLTEDEASAQKFRRMRDLNNEASRRCRENRKLKQEEAEMELQQLMVINQEKKRMVAEMEKQVKEMKARILQHVSGGQLLQQSQPPGQQHSNPPNLNSMWSDM
jgi:DNA anti-recombination protein RmuC